MRARIAVIAAAVFLLLAATLPVHAGEVVIHRMGGDIDVPSAPDGATLRTMGGDIRVGRAGARVSAKTMGGTIVIGQVDGSVDASTMGGDIRVDQVSAGNHDIELYTMGGNVEVTVPRSFGGSVSVEIDQSGSHREGHITSDLPLQQKSRDAFSFFNGNRRIVTADGQIGHGSSRLKITSKGGDVIIHAR